MLKNLFFFFENLVRSFSQNFKFDYILFFESPLANGAISLLTIFKISLFNSSFFFKIRVTFTAFESSRKQLFPAGQTKISVEIAT